MFTVALTLLALSVALAADAFAAAVCQGAIARPKPSFRNALRIGAAFGTAQAFMPLLGWLLGIASTSFVRDVDHWIAFFLLAGVGAKMLWETLEADFSTSVPLLTGWVLGAAAVATSIDAAAAGVTLPFIGASILVSAAAIGLVTLGLSTAGVVIGAAAGARIGKPAAAVGGLLLIGLGVKILMEHTITTA